MQMVGTTLLLYFSRGAIYYTFLLTVRAYLS